jgi:hypothetical protein
MTDDILQKMEERRKAKGNNVVYNRLNREIRKDCTEAKE